MGMVKENNFISLLFNIKKKILRKVIQRNSQEALKRLWILSLVPSGK